MLKKIAYIFLFTTFSAVSLLGQEADSAIAPYRQLYEELTHLKIDRTQFAEIENVILKRDAATFTLEKGEIYLCTPVQGRISAAIFTGSGAFSFTPTTKIEREHLERFYKKQSMDKPFRSLFLFFIDSTLAELDSKIDFREGGKSSEAQRAVDYALNYLHHPKAKYFDYSITKTFLEAAENGYFYAHFSNKHETDPFFFEINPHGEEEVSFMRRSKKNSVGYEKEVINQFHTAAEYVAGGPPSEENKIDLDIHKYIIDCHLEGRDLKFSATTIVDFESVSQQQKWLVLALFSELEVDSVFWENGEAADFVKDKDNPVLWIKADHPLKMNERRQLTLHYQGKLIERRRDWFFIRSSVRWYPLHGERDLADFELTFHVPKKMQFAAAGERVSSDTTDNVITSHWKSSRPLRNFSFNVGFFDEYKIENDTIPPISIMMASTGHQEVAQILAQQGIGSGKNMEKQVGKDIKDSAIFFQEMFGKIDIDQFYATEIPFSGHGEAFPGLVHLPWLTFHRTLADGSDEIFRAHEVAHQWWGIGVDFKTYHDQWISEGFSEYAGLWYYHQVVKKEEKDEKKFYKVMKERRKGIVNNRKFLLGDGQKAAPIWLGKRTYSSDTEQDFRIIIYQKGAWVLHMLRAMSLDLETLDDSLFRSLLKGFYQKYYHQKASTEDFIAFTESIFGQKLDWFFNQWVYDSELPTWRFAHKIEERAKNEYFIKCRVRQSEVGPDFKMPVLLGVEFKDKRIDTFRQLIAGTETVFELGPFKEKPKKVIFNHLESVLCKTKKEKYK